MGTRPSSGRRFAVRARQHPGRGPVGPPPGGWPDGPDPGWMARASCLMIYGGPPPGATRQEAGGAGRVAAGPGELREPYDGFVAGRGRFFPGRAREATGVTGPVLPDPPPVQTLATRADSRHPVDAEPTVLRLVRARPVTRPGEGLAPRPLPTGARGPDAPGYALPIRLDRPPARLQVLSSSSDRTRSRTSVRIWRTSSKLVDSRSLSRIRGRRIPSSPRRSTAMYTTSQKAG